MATIGKGPSGSPGPAKRKWGEESRRSPRRQTPKRGGSGRPSGEGEGVGRLRAKNRLSGAAAAPAEEKVEGEEEEADEADEEEGRSFFWRVPGKDEKGEEQHELER